MKKLSLFTGALLFSTLFYKQNIGLNLTLFSLTTILILGIYNPIAFKKKRTIAFCILYIITAISIFFYKSTLSIVANCVAFFTLIGHVSQYNSSIYINWINGLYTFIAGFFHRNFSVIENEQKVKPNKTIDYVHWTKIIGIPMVVVIVFISLYKNGNPVFSNLISKIDFGFLNFQWILLSALGYYLLYNISTPIAVNPATEIDLKTGNILKNSSKFSIENSKKENQLGVILISLLNLLIIIFLITDFTYLLSSNDLRASIFSNQVHSGINALIASIVMAIIIILYFFRGNLNFYRNNKTLKNLSYLWIILNIILVINTSVKDYQYIYYFGLTYKRIGVLIYLLLTIVGLITTSIKVMKIKNFWYLLRVNTHTAFTILIVCSVVNWDKHITFYNINYAQSMDFRYLNNLSNNNTFLLKHYCDYLEFKGKNNRLVNKKYNNYIKELNDRNWQELSYDNFKLDSEK
ncbi:DUF4173 domain-containing protein [Sabulilitoribacter multivorans]|uniref:DUF4173 domain-containing protein n=1 Tax=Flaviramulus multivorans TaxID=1304750 RepID=A0ABS9IJ42_9FLAO|nr:DUF4173 domain-containing protein [Flaviramulus multivorans]MCF7560437.1 DUF4173 domain-containing protein [Flaviramulus multivorans]